MMPERLRAISSSPTGYARAGAVLTIDLDAVREKLTEDLEKLGFTVTTNRVPYERHDSSEEED